jgi:hydroxymethylpyrimidine kinase / phosphomethylpyrimidine kinase / thiamine-phosphate diphosphorylase
MERLPVLWSVAGTDSGGAAGLAADQRAADALGVHLCPVVAAVTAQNSRVVTHVQALDAGLLDAQLAALADDMPPAAIKTGLLGSAANARVLVRWLDRLRAQAPVALVVDPVLRASTGASFVDADLLAAYRDELLPRATAITPNRREAALLLGAEPPGADGIPALARALQQRGARSVCITGGDADDNALVHDWLLSPHASGWLTLPRIDTAHNHGTGCTFASALAAALALGFVEADATVLAKMTTAQALRAGRAAGLGAGAVRAQAGFALQNELLPQLSFDDEAPAAWATPRFAEHAEPGLYAIVDSAERVRAVLAAGIRTVQLRIKRPAQDDEVWHTWLRGEIERSVATARDANAILYVNDHWQLALELGAPGVHLGQEDALALAPAERQRLQGSGIALGLSSHSLWELCRAAAMQPDYIACGPVWPTNTKQMPWRPQGLDNLAWWCAIAPAHVVAIGGVLAPLQAREAARCGAAGVCVVRGLGTQPGESVPGFAAAWLLGKTERAVEAPAVTAMPHPCL